MRRSGGKRIQTEERGEGGEKNVKQEGTVGGTGRVGEYNTVRKRVEVRERVIGWGGESGGAKKWQGGGGERAGEVEGGEREK